MLKAANIVSSRIMCFSLSPEWGTALVMRAVHFQHVG